MSAGPKRKTKKESTSRGNRKRLQIYSLGFLAFFLIMSLSLSGYAYWFGGDKVADAPRTTAPSSSPKTPSTPGNNSKLPTPNVPSPVANSKPAASDPPSAQAPEAKPTPTNQVKNGQEFDKQRIAWYYVPNNQHLQPFIPEAAQKMLSKYGGIYLGDAQSKKVYLTFDAGYENGYTAKILDTLKTDQVTAAFFVSKSFVTSQPDLIKRMVAEGHLVGNHTAGHPSLPSIPNDKIKKEIQDTEAAFTAVTGQSMARLVRPPEGNYNERVLKYLQQTGYRAVFWSMAFRDWNVNNQPGAEKAYQNVIFNIHPGAVILLHNVSSSNAAALHNIIYELKRQGYQFASLTELAGE